MSTAGANAPAVNGVAPAVKNICLREKNMEIVDYLTG